MSQLSSRAGRPAEELWMSIKAFRRRGHGDLTQADKDPLSSVPLLPPEPEVTIVRGLVDMEVQADEDVEFTCKVSQAGATDVQWHLQGLPLQSNEVTEVAVLGDGCTHVLQLKGVTLEDAGTVSFHVGSHSSSAQLTVRGIWL